MDANLNWHLSTFPPHLHSCLLTKNEFIVPKPFHSTPQTKDHMKALWEPEASNLGLNQPYHFKCLLF